MPLHRRCFLACGAAGLTAFALDAAGRRSAVAESLAADRLKADVIEKFVTPLVVPSAMPEAAPHVYRIAVRERLQQMLPAPFGPTRVWSYGAVGHDESFASPAFTIEATRGTPTEITWINDLTDPDGRFRPHLLPVDPTLHWANPPGRRDDRPTFDVTPSPYRGPVPLIAHVHGMAEIDDWSDGYPEAWVLPDAVDIPAGYATVGTWHDHFWTKSGRTDWGPGRMTFRYPNSQRPSTLWVHDHTLGITRLNVYAGLAGFYLIRSDDPADHPTDAAAGVAVLPAGAFEIPLAIQDRAFRPDGRLFYPDARRLFDGYAGPVIPRSAVPPIWVPEFFGDCIVVNGRTWPRHPVEPRRYRFRLLNGCNARFLILRFDHPEIETWVIGTEGGFLAAPVKRRDVLLAPGERVDVIVDFSRVPAGARVNLRNLGPDGPYRGAEDLEPADPRTSGQVMQFRLDRPLSAPDRTTPPGRLVMPAIAPFAGGRERALALAEAMTTPGKGAPIPHETVLGTFDPARGTPAGITVTHWGDPVTENPAPGDIETWAFHNFTEDAHPIHVHDVVFQVVDRQRMDPATGRTRGRARRPRPDERGFKDTVVVGPREIVRVRMRFGKPGQFVWHCHMLEHEDNEMMRPFRIGPEEPGAPQDHGVPKARM